VLVKEEALVSVKKSAVHLTPIFGAFRESSPQGLWKLLYKKEPTADSSGDPLQEPFSLLIRKEINGNMNQISQSQHL
jgi:hypothetical protein